MKLRLPSLLATAVVAVHSALIIKAETLIGTGNYYDVGKGSYSSDPQAHDMGEYASGGKRTDGVLCWAASASNLIQYWQDTYYDENAAQGTPNGLNPVTYNSPQGTRYLKVYEKFLSSSCMNKGGNASAAFDWWMKDTAVMDEGEYKLDNTKKWYYDSELFEGQESAAAEETDCFWRNIYSDVPYSTADLKENLQDAFAKQGQGVALQIWQICPEDPLHNSRNHAITCWGYESDETGVTALYLSDSDDYEFGVFRVNVSLGEVTNIIGAGETGYLTGLVLSTDEQLDGYSKDFEVALLSTNHIATPSSIAEDREDPEIRLQAGASITSNGLLKGTNDLSGAGITIGDGGNITVLSSDQDSTLSLTDAAAENTTGLTVMSGSLASLYGLSVEGYDKGGIVNTGRVYLHEGVVNLTGNSATDGAAINNGNYVSIEGNESVSITGNTAIGKGGAIYNTSELSIRGNAEVIFSGNTAAQGNDIYNAKGGSVNIADNGSVAFKGQNGEAAIVNDGTLYLKSGTDDRGISFQDASLDSRRGITYVGQDINGAITETSLKFADDTKTLTEISAKDTSLPAVLKEVKVGAAEIIGTGAGTASLQNSAVSCAADLRLSHLTLDASSKFTGQSEGKLTLDNLVIDLSGFEMSGEYAPEFDISGMFTGFGSMTVNSVYLDASSFELYENWDEYYSFVSVNFGEMLNDGTRLAVLIGNDMMTQNFEIYDGGNVMFWGEVAVPEPATGTLGLLALAGLAARRRRK